MSMEELNGPILHLVLSIKEGHGFGFLQTPMVVVASTSGLCLETEPIQPCPDPVIRTDLAWETDKKSLRGFRTSNTPVKVECFSTVNDVKHDRIGYILLNIKSAQVVPNGKHTKLLEKCHRLISVPQEAKLLKPELLLCLKITEANAPVSTCPSSSSGLCRTLPESPQSGRAPSFPLSLSYDVSLVPIFRPEENLVQIGPEDSCTNTFIFTLNIDKVGYISLLTPKKSELPPDISKSVHITCAIFSTTLATKPVSGESVILNGAGDLRLADERMQVKLFSSIPVLFRYFRENPTCTIQLYVSDREIAATELYLTALLRTDNTATFVKDYQSYSSKSQRCTWISSFTATIPAAPSGLKPFIDVTTRLEFAENQTVNYPDVKNQLTDSHLKNQVDADISSHWSENPCFTADTSFYGNEALNNERKTTVIKNNTVNVRGPDIREGTSIISDAPDEQFRSGDPSDFYSNPSGVNNTPFINVKPLTNDNDAVHKYCLRLSLTSATFDTVPSSKRLRFKFEYPNGHVLSSSITDVVSPTRCQAIELADIGATIVLYAPPSAMVTELRTGAVLVTVAEVKDDPSITTSFARASLPIFCVCLPGKVESLVTAGLEEDSSHLQIGTIHAHLSLEDCGRRHASSVRFQPHVPDIKKVPTLPPSNCANSSEMAHARDELEEWKDRQKEIFTAELKEKEIIFLEGASEMWLERKRQMEENLESKMAQCRSLSEALSVAREELCQRSKSCMEKEEQLKHLKDDLERQYNIKFQELTLAAKRLDEGVKVKVVLAETKCNELEDRVKALTTENEKLREELEKEKNYRRKLVEKTKVEEQSNGLNQQQVAKLLAQVKQLEEKLHISMKSKAYFKEQWGRAIREANISRNSNMKFSSVGSSLENVEETFSSLGGKGLEQILLQEEEELRRDSEALELLRRQIGDVCKRTIDV